MHCLGVYFIYFALVVERNSINFGRFIHVKIGYLPSISEHGVLHLALSTGNTSRTMLVWLAYSTNGFPKSVDTKYYVVIRPEIISIFLT